MSLMSSGVSVYVGEQKILVKKVRAPSKTWTPPANPQPKEMEEKKKEEEKEKNMTEEKPSPKTEAGKMILSGGPGRLRSRNFPGEGVSPGYTREDSGSSGSLGSRGERKTCALGGGIPKWGWGSPGMVSLGVKEWEIQMR